jgi:hypothetical protein
MILHEPHDHVKCLGSKYLRLTRLNHVRVGENLLWSNRIFVVLACETVENTGGENSIRD